MNDVSDILSCCRILNSYGSMIYLPNIPAMKDLAIINITWFAHTISKFVRIAKEKVQTKPSEKYLKKERKEQELKKIK